MASWATQLHRRQRLPGRSSMWTASTSTTRLRPRDISSVRVMERRSNWSGPYLP